jgi:hypothetical protein
MSPGGRATFLVGIRGNNGVGRSVFAKLPRERIGLPPPALIDSILARVQAARAGPAEG